MAAPARTGVAAAPAHVCAGVRARLGARASSRSRAAAATDALFSTRARRARSRRAGLPASCARSPRCVVLARAFGEITSLTGRRQLRWIAWGTALGVGPVRARLRAAVGARRRSAAGAAAHGGAARPRAARLCVGDRALPPARRRGHHQARPRLHGVPRRQRRRSTSRCASWSASSSATTRDPHNWIVALLATTIVVLLAQPVREAVQNALDRVFYRDRYDYRRALVGFARDLNSDLDVVRLSQRLVTRIVETLVVDRMALMLADERARRLPGDRRLRFQPAGAAAVARRPRSSPRLDAGHTVALDDPIAAARFAGRGGRVLARPGHLLLRALRLRRRARSPCSRSAARRPTSRSTARTSRCSRRSPARSPRPSRTAACTASCTSRPRNSAGCASSTRTSSSRSTTAWSCSTRTSASSAGTTRSRTSTASRALTPSGGRSRDVFDAPFVEALRAARAREPARGDALQGAARRRAGRPTATASRRGCWSMRPSSRCRTRRRATPSTGTILLIENVTDRVRLEEQLQISEKMASIGLLAAGVAHEVNTPLTGISSYTQMLLEGADPQRSAAPCCSRRSSGRRSAPRRSSTAC